jgi:hypothetical protein
MRKLLIGLLGVVAFVSLAPAAHAAFPGLNGKIAFFTAQGTSDDIWVMQPDGSAQTAITGPGVDERDPAWSPDGTKIAFVGGGANYDIYVMNADGTGAVNLTNHGADDTSPSWSPDGKRIVFSSNRSGDFQAKIYVMNADGSDQTRVTEGFTADRKPAWSPDGRYIAFVRRERIFKMNPDGTGVTQITSSATRADAPNWSPDGGRIAYTRFTGEPGTTGIHTVSSDGTDDVDLSAHLTEAHDPAWSPDGSKLVVSRNGHVWSMNANGAGTPTQLTTVFGTNGSPDWQPLPFPGYPRPKGAWPLRVPLVPAYGQCTAPNRTHGPPLDFDSCHPPAPASPNLTIGTPDAGGGAANSSGFVLLRVIVGSPGPPEDSDAPISVSLTDVRCKASILTCGAANASGGADYTGELRAEFVLRLTDRWNGTAPGGGTDAATMTDFTFQVPVTCTGTSDTALGSTCTIKTTANLVYPGSVKDGKRAIWGMSDLRVLDGGPDGDVDTTPNSLFAMQGVFVP